MIYKKKPFTINITNCGNAFVLCFIYSFIENNEITCKGIVKFAEGMEINSGLEVLDLGNCSRSYALIILLWSVEISSMLSVALYYK